MILVLGLAGDSTDVTGAAIVRRTAAVLDPKMAGDRRMSLGSPRVEQLAQRPPDPGQTLTLS